MRTDLWSARLLFLCLGIGLVLFKPALAQTSSTQPIDPRVWSQHYWQKLAARGLVEVAKPAPVQTPPPSAAIFAMPGVPVDSRDVPVSPLTNITQSENSIFVHPNDLNTVLNSNNSTSWPVSSLFGTSGFISEDGGVTWRGQANGTGGNNSGDPATAIDRNGRFFVGYIAADDGQGVARSLNRGQTWTHVQAATTRGASVLDKNHLWVDNSPASPFAGNLYSAWTMFGGANDAEIEITRSTDGGLTWSAPLVLSRNVNALSHNQGVHIQTGPNGEVYVMWAIYDAFPADETALGFALSRDGGATFEPARRIITNIRGIRNSGTGKGIRTASFPVMTADLSNSPRRGTLYAVWANRGTPGNNTGNDVDGYLIKSTDHGATWSSPVRINQDAPNLAKKHFFHWITCDPANGNLSVIYYDDRNVSSIASETFVSNSIDGGATWLDFRVSDVSFLPSPIPGLANGYFGDYLGIAALGGKVYPTWTDNRDGRAMTYVSPFILEQDSIPPAAITDLRAGDPSSNGIVLQWTAHGDDGDSGRAASYDIRYALAPIDSLSFAAATRATNRLVPQLPGSAETFEVTGLNFNTTYFFAVKILDEQNNASAISNLASTTTLGAPSIAISPTSLADTLLTGANNTQTLTLRNLGAGTLDFTASATSSSKAWLSVTPISGRVFAGTPFDLQVRFDATGLDGGSYNGEIVLASNDPNNSSVRVPVRLQVIGAPDINFSKSFFDFDSVLVTDTLALHLEISNPGTDVLQVNLSTTSPFAATPSAFTLPPRTTQSVEVSFLPTTVGVFADSLIVTSNDPDEARVSLGLKGVSLPPPEIEIAPTRLDENLSVGQTRQQTVTISNIGLSDLNFDLAFENAQVRLSGLRQENQRENATAMRAEFGPELLRLARAATAGLAFPTKIGDDNEGLAPELLAKFRAQAQPYMQMVARVNQTAAMPSLAVAGFNSASLMSILLSLSNSVSDYVYTDVGDNFTLATLQSFDAVIVDERDFRLTLAEAQALRDYAATGKSVFIGMDDFDNLAADVQAVIYPLLGVSAAFDADFVFSAFNPAHPITQNLSTMESFNSVDNDYFTLDGGEWLFADPTNRYFGVAYQTRSRTALFGESLFAIVLNNPNNLLLLSNAIDWIAASVTGWVTVDKTADVLAPNTSANITVTFNAQGFRGGDYTADLVVTSNDPDEKRTFVPVHLIITNAPDIAVASDTLDFGEVFLGAKDSLFATVTNLGTFDLLITSATTAPEVFTVTPPFAGINPGERENFKVRFMPTTAGDYSGTLTLTNNDPDENPKVITLLGKGLTPPVISAAPDSFAFVLNSGDSTSATLTLANNGGSALHFTLRDTESGNTGGGQYVFWSQEYQAGPDTIFRANLDGTDIRPVYVGNLQSGYGSIAYHPTEGRIYSAEYAEGRIFSVKVDGTDPRILVTSARTPYDLALDLSAGHMYWAESNSTGMIKRANLDGSNIITLVQSPGANGSTPTNKYARGNIAAHTTATATVLNRPWALDLDLVNGKIYWSELGAQRIMRANLDGSGVELVSANVGAAVGMKLDLNASKIYFASSGSVQRMNLDGSNQETVLQTGSSSISDFKLDLAAKQFYWADYGVDRITRANFDGSNIMAVVTRAASSSDGPFALGLTGSGGDWLSETPTRGTVAAGASLPVTIQAKSKGLLGGNYRGAILLSSNDPLTPEVVTPVTLQVIGAPLVEVAPDSVIFKPTFVGQIGRETLIVRNTGTEDLLVSNFQIAPSVFTYADSAQFTLRPGAARALPLFFQPQAAQVYDGTLSFATNDARRPNVSVPLFGEGLLAPAIAASPDSLCDSLKTGESKTRVLTLRNNGGSALSWSASVDFSATSLVAQQSPRFVSQPIAGASKHARNAPLPHAEHENVFTFPNTSVPNLAPARSTTLEQSLDSTLAKLNRNFAQVNGAIPNRFDFFEGEIGNNINDGGNDMYDGGNFISTNFGSSIFYSNNRIISNPAFGTNGLFFTRKYPGLFVLAAEMNNVSTFTIDGNLGADGGGNVDGAILETTLYGVTFQGFVKRVFNAGDPSVNHLIIIAKDPIATHALGTSTDSDFHAVRNLNGTTRLYYLLYAGANGDYIDNAATLNLFNAFLAALELLPEWLALAPTSGVIAPNAAQEVQATFDATGLAGGNYHARIALASNAPNTPLLRVPACLNVIGAPVIQLSDTALVFPDVFVGGYDMLSFGVKNTGNDTLRVHDISASTSVFSATPNSFTLAPQQEQKVLARFAPDALGPIHDVLTITSNAVNLPQAFVAVSGVGIAPPIIAVMPDSLSFVVDENQTATEFLTITNNGNSPLEFSIRDEEQRPNTLPGTEKKIYWSNLGSNRPPAQIFRSALDGSNLETIFSGGGNIRGIAIDEQQQRLYWCDSFQRAIFSSTLDGDSTHAVVSNLSFPVDLALDVERNHMYWTDLSAGTIGRADLDGGNVIVLVRGAAHPLTNIDVETQSSALAPQSRFALNSPFGLTLDLQNDKIYWTETNGNRIGRANLDGTGVETVLTSPHTNGPRGIRLDLAQRKIYFLDTNVDQVKRANFDGSNVETLATLSFAAFLELLELDLSEGKMYWTDFGLDNLVRANLDGSAQEILQQAPNAFDTYGVALLNTGWLSETPVRGIIAPGASENLALTANTKDLAAGDYMAQVFISSNDPIDSVKVVRVHLRVRTSDVFLALADSSFGVPRDTVDVPVQITFKNPRTLAALQASIKLSNPSLAFLAYTPGPVVERGLRVHAPAADSVSVTFASEGGQYLKENGVLATLHFRVADNATPGQTTALRFLHLSATDSVGAIPTLSSRNGLFFTRKAPEVSGSAKYARVSGGGNAAQPVVGLSAVLSRNGALVQQQATNSSGRYALTNILPRTNYRVELRRENGGLGTAISPTDALFAFNGYLGNLTLTGAQNLAADVDADLNITPGDALAIFNRFLGVSNQYPVADWRAYPASYAIDANVSAWKNAPTGVDYPAIMSDQLNQDYVALARGDVDLSWASSANAAILSAETQRETSAPNAVTFKLNEARLVPGTDKIIVPLILHGVALERGLYAFGGELQYASTQMQITAVHWGPLVPQQAFRASYALSHATDASAGSEETGATKLAGRLRFGAFATASTVIRQSGVLLEIEARLLEHMQAGAKLVLRLHETSAAIGINAIALQSGAGFEAARVSVEQSEAVVLAAPATFALHRNYPNPFNPTTELRYQLPEPATVSLTIFNALGQKVRTLVYAEKQSSGYYRHTWDGKNERGEVVSAGVYFYHLEAQSASVKFQRTNKMLMLK